MANFFVDPSSVALPSMTRARILENLPKVQRNKRRAARLRGQQAALNAMRDKEQELGGFIGRPTKGGLGYDVVQSYIPNYAGMGEKLVGGIGGIFAEKQADAAEDEYNAERNKEIMDTLGEYGAKNRIPGSATDRELRAYLGLMGEDTEDLGIEDESKRRVHGLKTDTKGKVWSISSDPGEAPIDTGIIEGSPYEIVKDPVSGRSYRIPRRYDDNTARPVMEPQELDPGLTEGGIPPEVQQRVMTGKAAMEAAGMPQEQVDAYVAGEINAAMGGAPAAEEPMAPPQQPMAPPASAPAPVPPPQAAAPPAPMAPQAGAPMPPPPGAQQPLVMSGVQEQEAAKLAAQNEAAAESAAREGMQSESEKRGQIKAAATEQLAKARNTANVIRGHVNYVKKHQDVLKKLVGGSMTGRISSLGGVGKALNNALLGGVQIEGQEGADMLAAINQLGDESFLASYQDALEGTGQVATVEATRTAMAVLRDQMYQSPERYTAALDEFLKRFDQMHEAMEHLSNMPVNPQNSIPQGWDVQQVGD